MIDPNHLHRNLFPDLASDSCTYSMRNIQKRSPWSSTIQLHVNANFDLVNAGEAKDLFKSFILKGPQREVVHGT